MQQTIAMKRDKSLQIDIGEVAAVIAQEGFESLDAPVTRLGAKDTPVPYNWFLEAEILPQLDDIVAAIRELAEY